MMSVDKMEQWADSYIEFQKKEVMPSSNSDEWWPVRKFYDMNEDHPELCWHVILLILDKTDNENVLDMLAVGPLEDLIDSHGETFIDKIEAEASQNIKFLNALSKVWQSSTPDVWRRIQVILSSK